MPKCYSDQERAAIRARLHAQAARCIAARGLTHTTVDALVKGARIPKGTFYLFYPSKEALLFEVLAQRQQRLEEECVQALQTLAQGAVTADALAETLFQLYKKVSEDPVLSRLQARDIALLAKKLPPALLAEHFAQDGAGLQKLQAALPGLQIAQPQAVSAALRALYLTTVHKTEIGAAQYDAALQLLLRGLALQLLA